MVKYEVVVAGMCVVTVVVVPDPLDTDVNAIVRSIIKRMYP